MNENLKIFFETLFGAVPQIEWDLLKTILEPMEVQKGADIHKIGKLCKHLWYLDKGAVRVYEYANDTERTTHFFVENNLFIDYHSVLTKSPSEIGFKAEENCMLQQMPYDKLLLLFDKSHYLERLARHLENFEIAPF